MPTSRLWLPTCVLAPVLSGCGAAANLDDGPPPPVATPDAAEPVLEGETVVARPSPGA